MFEVNPARIPTLGFVFLLISAAAVAQSVVMPANLAVGSGATVSFSVSLSTGAPVGGLTVTLTSDRPETASVWPPAVVIPVEMTTPPRLTPIITGHQTGIVTIRATAPGYTTGLMQVQVGGGNGSNPGTGAMTVSPANLSITGSATQNLTIILSVPAPAGGAAVSIVSSNTSVATVPAAVNVPAGTTTATVPVTGGATGSATITAISSEFGSVLASVVVVQGGGGGSGLPGIAVPQSLTLTSGDVREFPMQLSVAAPAGGVTVTASSTDTGRVNISQTSVYIPDGMTSVPRKVTTIQALNSGVATIDVSAPGYAPASTQVQVTGSAPPPTGGGTMSFAPSALSLLVGETKTVTLSLSSPAGSDGLRVNLSSSNPATASVPPTITIAAGTATYNVQITGVGVGTSSITASAANYSSASVNVSVAGSNTPPSQSQIVVPSSLTMLPGDSAVLTVALPLPAGAGGVLIALTTSDPAKVTVYPDSFVIPDGATASRRVEVIVRGIAVGSATITAAAPGYLSGSAQVQVKSAAPGGTMTLTPSSLSLVNGATQNLTLGLSGTLPPNGLVVYLASSNTSAATTLPSIKLPPGATAAEIPVSCVGSGAATITATAANFGSATATVNGSAVPQINLPSNVTLSVGETVNFPVTLSAAALSDTVITLNSSDTSKLTVTPGALTILKGMTSAPNVTATVKGVTAGTATITSTAPGLTSVSKQVTVTSVTPSPVQVTMGFTPANLSITGFVTQNLTLTFSGPVPAPGQYVTLKSSNTAAATVNHGLQISAGSTSVSIPVTAVSVGSTIVTASAPGIEDATATVTVLAPGAGTLSMPASWSVSPGQSNTLQVTLTPVAPAGGLTLTFTSNDSSKVTLTPGVLNVAGGAATALVQINGVAAGNAVVSASAPGYTGASSQVQVFTATGSGAFIPGILALNSGVTDTVFLSLGPQPPGGLTVTLSSSDPTVVTVPSTVVVPMNTYGVSIPVTGMKGGKATVIATVNGYMTTPLNVTVLDLNAVTVEWHGPCWVPFPDGKGGEFWRHAFDFQLKTPSPITVQASLFYTSSNCTGLVDNMNDFDAPTSAGHIIQGFVNYPYPYYKPASALVWIGSRTLDGKCQPGSPCSGCMAYTDKTPMCNEIW